MDRSLPRRRENNGYSACRRRFFPWEPTGCRVEFPAKRSFCSARRSACACLWGRFAFQPTLGSRLYTLRPETEDKDANALAMAQEARAGIAAGVGGELLFAALRNRSLRGYSSPGKGGGAEIEGAHVDGDI